MYRHTSCTKAIYWEEYAIKLESYTNPEPLFELITVPKKLDELIKIYFKITGLSQTFLKCICQECKFATAYTQQAKSNFAINLTSSLTDLLSSSAKKLKIISTFPGQNLRQLYNKNF